MHTLLILFLLLYHHLFTIQTLKQILEKGSPVFQIPSQTRSWFCQHSIKCGFKTNSEISDSPSFLPFGSKGHWRLLYASSQPLPLPLDWTFFPHQVTPLLFWKCWRLVKAVKLPSASHWPSSHQCTVIVSYWKGTSSPGFVISYDRISTLSQASPNSSSFPETLFLCILYCSEEDLVLFFLPLVMINITLRSHQCSSNYIELMQ